MLRLSRLTASPKTSQALVAVFDASSGASLSSSALSACTITVPDSSAASTAVASARSCGVGCANYTLSLYGTTSMYGYQITFFLRMWLSAAVMPL